MSLSQLPSISNSASFPSDYFSTTKIFGDLVFKFLQKVCYSIEFHSKVTMALFLSSFVFLLFLYGCVPLYVFLLDIFGVKNRGPLFPKVMELL